MNIGSWIASAASALVVLGILGRWTRQAFNWCQRLMASVAKVESRSKELITNGGSTMRDEVAAMRKVLAEQSAVMAEQSATLARQDEVIADLRRQRRFGIWRI